MVFKSTIFWWENFSSLNCLLVRRNFFLKTTNFKRQVLENNYLKNVQFAVRRIRRIFLSLGYRAKMSLMKPRNLVHMSLKEFSRKLIIFKGSLNICFLRGPYIFFNAHDFVALDKFRIYKIRNSWSGVLRIYF